MKEQKLDDLLKEWEGTWERPSPRVYVRQLSRITLVLVLLFLAVYSCERLKEKAAPDQHIEARQIKNDPL